MNVRSRSLPPNVMKISNQNTLRIRRAAHVLVSSRAMNFSSSANLTETIFITLVAAREYQMVAIGLVGKRGML